MKYIREDDMFYFCACESCGNELQVAKFYCKPLRDGGYYLRTKLQCACGGNSSDIKVIRESVDNTPARVNDEPIKCPKCKSIQLIANNKGFGLGKAAVGGLALGPVGLLGGLVGSKKLMVSCMKCGHRWKAGS